MRRVLDGLYLLCGALAAVFLVAIALLVLASILTRLTALQAPGLGEYAGYCMAASSFLALAYAFGHDEHIRVSLVLNALHGRARRAAELWCLAVGFGLAAYFAYYSVKMVRISRLINDVSPGPDATPLWIPQLAMAAGTVVLAIALLDRLVQVARGAPLR
ncbi:MAG: TRAP transporter small permease [Candidatus Competibacterales bacterium]|nr:TRAP transporter small permease [Candidatus Competibacterales bacterium]